MSIILYEEDFGSGPFIFQDGVTHRNLKAVYLGYGFGKIAPITEPKNGRNGSCLHFKPQQNDAHTSACLIRLENKEFTNFDETFYLRTVEQTKTRPEPWETGWFMWGYTDDTHHYYTYIGNTGKLEIGKKDYVKIGTSQIKTPDGKVTTVTNMPGGQDQQVFLFTKENAVEFALNKWFKIRLVIKGINIKIYVDGKLLADINDDGNTGNWLGKPVTFKRSAQMAKGKLSWYSEDAYVQVDNIIVRSV